MNFDRNTLRGVLLYVAVSFLAACTGNQTQTDQTEAIPAVPQAPPKATYPAAAREDVTDDYHGTRVADPYRWMENLDSSQTQQWVSAENALAEPQLAAIPQRAWIRQRLTQLWRYDRYDVPTKHGKNYFYLRNDGTQNQAVLYAAPRLNAEPRVLFDPNKLRDDATVSLSDVTPSSDGKLVAYALSDGGTDWQLWHFKRVADGVELKDVLRHSKFWGVSWLPDNSGVFYSRYPLKPDGTSDGSGQPSIYFHKLGEPQDQDRLVYALTDHPTRIPSGEVTDDGRYLIVHVHEGFESNGIRILDLRQPNAKVQPFFEQWDAKYEFIGSRGTELFFQTTNSAPRGRVIAVDARKPDPSAWREVVPQAEMALNDSAFLGGRIVVDYVKDARAVARLYERSGKLVGDVPLPGLGSLAGFNGNGKEPETFFSYMDYLTPGKIFHYDVRTNKATSWKVPRLAASTDPYVTEQVFYKSKDGTQIPMFITHRKDMEKNGSQPVLLYGYGGFNVSLTPAFRTSILVWLEMGGVYAEANLRGGGEYGEAWHKAGTRAQKQNVFDDFVAGAEYLINEGYTRPSRLAIHGRSNGGLLAGAALTQRPDLFGAALPAVGVLDMLRYQTASANARQWSSDYGLSENAEDFQALRAYSPYHNVKEGQCYPPTLITTADHDDRVVPWHSYKFAAALQHAQGCANPVLIRVETRAGHGAGKPVSMQIENFADQWAFLAEHLDIAQPRPPAPAVTRNGAVAGD